MARELKIYTVEGRYSHAPQDALNALQAPSHIRQATMYVIARTKKDAVQYLNDATRSNFKLREMHLAMGNNLDAILTGSSYLSEEKEVAITWGRGSQNVVIQGPGGWKLVGETIRIIPGERRTLLKPVFRAIDPTPAPVRITIELDANTDPAVIETFQAGLSVIIASSINDKATGTVVES